MSCSETLVTMLGGSMLLAMAMASPSPPVENPRDLAWRYSLAAGLTGGMSVSLIFMTAARRIEEERCRVDSLQDGFGGFGGGFGSACGNSTQSLTLVGATAYGIAATVLSGYAGDRLAQNAKDRLLTARQAQGFIAGGVAMRLVGLGVALGAIALPNANACNLVRLGEDEATGVEPHMQCYRRRTLGAAAMVSVGFGLRWAGGGFITYGARHKAQSARFTLRPFVQPTVGRPMLGLTGRF